MAFSGVGFISQVGTRIREYMDDPSSSARFSDAQIKDAIHARFQEVVEDINRVSTGRIRSTITISVLAKTMEYVLPPNIGTFLEFKKLDADNNPEFEIIPRDPLNPVGPGFTIEGGILLRLDRKWDAEYTMTIVYTPTGEASIFEGTAVTFTASTLTVPATVTEGVVDRRTNAYLGAVIQMLSATGLPEQDRIISSQTNATPGQPVFTVKPDFSPVLAGTPIFQVLPDYALRYKDVIALRVAMFLSAIRKNRDGYEFLRNEYQQALRSLRLHQANVEGRRGMRFSRAVRDRRTLGKLR